MKLDQVRCDKCGNLLENGRKEDHNVLRIELGIHTYAGEADLCEKCMHKFQELFKKWLEDK